VLSRSSDPLSVATSDLIADVQAMAGHDGRVDEALLDAAMRDWSVNTRRAFRSDLTSWGHHLGVRQRKARGIRFKGDIADLDSPESGVCLTHLQGLSVEVRFSAATFLPTPPPRPTWQSGSGRSRA
jgi:hypothetical protein